MENNNTTTVTERVGVAVYFGLIVLFSVPIVGLIASAVMSFATKNDNIRNFARAALIAILLWILISAAAFFGVMSLADSILAYVKDVGLQEMFNSLGLLI